MHVKSLQNPASFPTFRIKLTAICIGLAELILPAAHYSKRFQSVRNGRAELRRQRRLNRRHVRAQERIDRLFRGRCSSAKSVCRQRATPLRRRSSARGRRCPARTPARNGCSTAYTRARNARAYRRARRPVRRAKSASARRCLRTDGRSRLRTAYRHRKDAGYPRGSLAWK